MDILPLRATPDLGECIRLIGGRWPVDAGRLL